MAAILLAFELDSRFRENDASAGVVFAGEFYCDCSVSRSFLLDMSGDTCQNADVKFCGLAATGDVAWN